MPSLQVRGVLLFLMLLYWIIFHITDKVEIEFERIGSDRIGWRSRVKKTMGERHADYLVLNFDLIYWRSNFNKSCVCHGSQL
jgi:hypothetical protein